MPGDPLRDEDYATLATFRYELRCFLRFSEEAAIAAGLTPQHYQVLLALRAAADGALLVGALAEQLALRPHSTTELVNRLEKLGLVARRQADDDRRKVRVSITAAGRTRIASLAAAHRDELRRLRPMLESLLDKL